MEMKAALTIPEFCQRYSVGRSFTYDEIKAGKLKIRKAGKKTLILTSDADNWLNALPESKVSA